MANKFSGELSRMLMQPASTGGGDLSDDELISKYLTSSPPISTSGGEAAGSGEPSLGKSAIQGASQGLTAGFSDEILAGLNSLYEGVAHGRNVKEAYRETRDNLRGQMSEGKEAHPWGYGLAEVVGAIGTGPAAAGMGPAAGGAAFGAAAGAGHSEADTLGGVAKDAAVGGAVGGVLGGAVGGKLKPWMESAPARASNAVSAADKTAALETEQKTLMGSLQEPVVGPRKDFSTQISRLAEIEKEKAAVAKTVEAEKTAAAKPSVGEGVSKGLGLYQLLAHGDPTMAAVTYGGKAAMGAISKAATPTMARLMTAARNGNVQAQDVVDALEAGIPRAVIEKVVPSAVPFIERIIPGLEE